MDAVSSYSFANAAWLGIQGVPLVIWPSFISSLLREDYQHASSLEDYFARSLGFALLALALSTIVLTGAVPLTSIADAPDNAISPYATAILFISTIHHSSAAFYCYARYTRTEQGAFMAGCLGSSALAFAGLFCMLFAGDKTRMSKRHGFDKDTSGFPFKNVESYKTKKKREKGL